MNTDRLNKYKVHHYHYYKQYKTEYKKSVTQRLTVKLGLYAVYLSNMSSGATGFFTLQENRYLDCPVGPCKNVTCHAMKKEYYNICSLNAFLSSFNSLYSF